MRNLHDKVDFVRLWHHDPDMEGGINVFSGWMCGTVSKYLPAARESDRVGYPISKDLGQWAMPDSTKITAVTVPKGYIATIYMDEHFRGRSLKINGQEDEWEAMTCQKLPDNMRGFKSVRIERNLKTNKSHRAYSSWVQIGNGYDPVMLTPGEDIIDNDLLWWNMIKGLDFQVGRVLDNISSDYVYDIQSMVTSTQNVLYDYTKGLTCPEKRDGSGNLIDVGMWLYVVQSDDRMTTVSSPTTRVCRYGALWNDEPQCPLPACVDT
jgi:hypothetical protein